MGNAHTQALASPSVAQLKDPHAKPGGTGDKTLFVARLLAPSLPNPSPTRGNTGNACGVTTWVTKQLTGTSPPGHFDLSIHLSQALPRPSEQSLPFHSDLHTCLLRINGIRPWCRPSRGHARELCLAQVQPNQGRLRSPLILVNGRIFCALYLVGLVRAGPACSNTEECATTRTAQTTYDTRPRSFARSVSPGPASA